MNNLDLQQVATSVAQPVIIQDTLNGFSVTSTEAMEEASLYKQLSAQLIELEKTTDYNVELVVPIREVAEKMYVNFEEKAELLMRCEWLVDMKGIENEIPLMDSLDKVQLAKRKLGRVQTCPLKLELKVKLDALEEKYVTVNVLSSKEQLVEDIFATGNETFINLGSSGRDYVLEEVLKEKAPVEMAIAKAVELEAKVEAAKQATTIEELKSKLQSLPLAKLSEIPTNYETEVLQYLLDQPNWSGLFQLDRQIHQFTEQVKKKNDPVQEGVLDTLVLDDKVIDQLGLQKVQD